MKKDMPVPEGCMRNSRGGFDPIEHVKPVDKLRDEMVREIVRESMEASQRLKEMKQRFFETISSFVELSAEQYGVKPCGKKGNMQFLSYDGEYKVLVSVNENIVFDERLQIAKDLIDDCINDWSQDSRSEIRALIQDAFYVGKSGQINRNRILGLRRLDIQDERWQKAMQAISDSIQVSGSKSFLRIYRRDPEDAEKYSMIDLGTSAL